MQQLFLKAVYLLGLAVLTIELAYAQPDWLRYPHYNKGSQIVLNALEASTSECLRLTANTVLQDDAPCILVGDGVTLDLNGRTVFGNILGVGFDSGSDLTASGNDVTIQNGTVAGGSVVLLGTNNLLNMIIVRDSESTFAVQIGGGVIDRSVFERNIVAVDLFFGGGVEVRRSVFHDNDIGVNIPSDNNSSVLSNVFRENDTGVRIFDEDYGGASGNMIRRNFFHENAIGVFLDARSEANDNDIHGNWFFSNASSAIVVRLACERMFTDQCAGRGTQIRQNWFILNGGQSQLLSDSWILASGEEQPYEVALDDGLTVVALPEPGVADGAIVTHNLTLLNADLGIDAPGATDGGQNRAANNGNPQQCVGVQCDFLGEGAQMFSQN